VAFSLILSAGISLLYAIKLETTMGFFAAGSAVVLISTLVLTFVLLLISAAMRTTFKLNTAQNILDKLAPVANSDFYRLSALGYVRDSENAQHYMNQVRSTGRALCVIDFQIAYKLAIADRGT
jgi:archaellum component FlaF (FlaF/FlaG flagellin family)